MRSQVYARIGAHYDQEIACCAMWVMAQFLENRGDFLDKVSDQIGEIKESAEQNEDEITKCVADFARLGFLAALHAAGQRYMVKQGEEE